MGSIPIHDSNSNGIKWVSWQQVVVFTLCWQRKTKNIDLICRCRHSVNEHLSTQSTGTSRLFVHFKRNLLAKKKKLWPQFSVLSFSTHLAFALVIPSNHELNVAVVFIVIVGVVCGLRYLYSQMSLREFGQIV